MKRIRPLLVILLSILWISPLLAQEPPSLHQLALEMHANTPPSPDLLGTPGEPILPLQKRAGKAAQLSATVFGYLPYWSSSAYLRFDLLTHIAAFAVAVNPNGTLGNDHGWPWTNLINQAHSRGVKVILTATLFDGQGILTLVTSPENKARFFSNIKNKMLEGNADGVNIDFEGSSTREWRRYINDFMAEFTEYLHTEVPGSEVSFAGPSVNWSQSWDLPGLAASCDYVFIMGYAFYGSWSSNTGANAPLTGGSINITNTVTVQYGAVTRDNPEKLILGLPYYGSHWLTFSDAPNANVLDWIGAKFYKSAMEGALTYGLLWDSDSQTPWYTWNDGSNWHQVWFDNDSSLGLKYDLAQVKSLRGVGMWALGYDGDRQELWNLLDQKFGSGIEPVPDVPLSFRVLHENVTSLRVEVEPSARASGYFVYSSRDGLNFPDSLFFPAASGIVPNLPAGEVTYFRVAAVNATGLSRPTEVLAGRPSEQPHSVLIVNGFDRVSGSNNTFDYVRQHAAAIARAGFALSSASNEAVFRDRVALADFSVVDWLLGDESTADDTFNPLEQERVEAFLQQGGMLFVSGSEIGWDLQEKGSSADRAFYQNFLKANYIDDAPKGKKATYYVAEALPGTIFDGLGQFSFDDGSHGTFDVDWPDAITGAGGGTLGLKYASVAISPNGGAGIFFEGMFPGGNETGKLVHLAVPFETIYPEQKRFDLMQQILDFFGGPTTGVADAAGTPPMQFRLQQNYPNPFNPRTVIGFSLPGPGTVRITIYNTLGRRLRSVEQGYDRAGAFQWQWDARDDAGQRVASGTYIYRAIYENSFGQTLQQSRRMTLLR